MLCRKENQPTWHCCAQFIKWTSWGVGCVRYAPACIHVYSLQSIGTCPNCHSDEYGQWSLEELQHLIQPVSVKLWAMAGYQQVMVPPDSLSVWWLDWVISSLNNSKTFILDVWESAELKEVSTPCYTCVALKELLRKLLVAKLFLFYFTGIRNLI